MQLQAHCYSYNVITVNLQITYRTLFDSILLLTMETLTNLRMGVGAQAQYRKEKQLVAKAKVTPVEPDVDDPFGPQKLSAAKAKVCGYTIVLLLGTANTTCFQPTQILIHVKLLCSCHLHSFSSLDPCTYLSFGR